MPNPNKQTTSPKSKRHPIFHGWRLLIIDSLLEETLFFVKSN